jgi:hypothetical protein
MLDGSKKKSGIRFLINLADKLKRKQKMELSTCWKLILLLQMQYQKYDHKL